ncbi:nitrate reductase [Chelonobacter oris]|uniref:Cytochrome c-type protein n=1 Tax=Chelonobacter oris TaxID=505317 RepID=A0A0A3AJE5_9PAST|nr:NapC/NirT family cytochrome c [Chelonobacter oris]KGQ69451.1 nitrate reductase [Chelonobacter oris]MDH3000093.1 nitrate reductase [Chelonobacter oris]
MLIKKKGFIGGIILIAVGAIGFWLTQTVFHKTSSTEFCISCHSMTTAKEEWEGSVHFANKLGIRAECSDCHLPPENWHYIKAKFIALKDVWGELTGKIPDAEAFEQHRLQMAQTVWEQMKALDSSSCRTCHKTDAWILSEQSEQAQTMHKLAIETNQTCIDCHKGIVHFMPDVATDSSAASGELSKHAGQFANDDKTLYLMGMSSATAGNGQVRLMPFARLVDWQADNNDIKGTVNGWQQAGAESLIYQQMGKRIIVAVVDDDAKSQITVLKTVHDDITDSDWHEVNIALSVDKAALTSDINALNQYGKSLDQTHCSTCHAPIAADHYTANQWVGVINSMKDRTSMNDEEVRTITLYLQHFAKDMGSSH